MTVSAVMYSLGMFLLNDGVFPDGVHTATLTWENICTSTESIIFLATLCVLHWVLTAPSS